MNTRLYTTAMNEVKAKMANGTALPCTSTYGLTKQNELGFNDLELAYALSAAWAAGIGTVSRFNSLTAICTNHSSDHHGA